MSIDEMVKIVTDAVNGGKISKRKVYKPDCKAINRMLMGKSVSVEILGVMYERVVKILADAKSLENRENENERLKTEVNLLKIKVQSLELENEKLKAEIVLFKEKQSEQEIVKSEEVCYKENDRVQGFKLRKEEAIAVRYDSKGGKHDKEYMRYYAKKRIEGKLHRIYLGSSLERGIVDEKVAAYVAKYGLDR